MGQLFKALKAEETGGSFNGVHRAKGLGKQRTVVRLLLEIGEAPLHAIEAFLALDEELPCQVVGHVDSFRLPGVRIRRRKHSDGLSDR